MAAAWPTAGISRDYYTRKPYKRQVRTEMENGAVQSRAGGKRARRLWTVGWKALPNAQYAALEEHFDENLGGSFSFTDPVDGVTYEVRYSKDELPQARCARDAEATANRLWDTGSIAIEEL